MGSSSDYELQSKDRGREGKNHFFFLLVVIVTPSPRQCHTTSLEINVAKTWRDWKDLQHMTRYESAIIVNTQTHTHILVLDGTECNVFQNSIPSLQFLSKKPLGASLWPNRFASHIYKQIYSI